MILYYYDNHIIILSNTATDITLYLPWWLVRCHKKSCCNLSFTFWSIASLKPPAFTRLFLQIHSPPAKAKRSLQSQVDPYKEELWARSVCFSQTISAVTNTKPTVHMLYIRSSNAQTCLWNIHPHTHSTHADVHTHASNGLSCNYSHLSKAHLDLWSN